MKARITTGDIHHLRSKVESARANQKHVTVEKEALDRLLLDFAMLAAFAGREWAAADERENERPAA